MSLLFFTSLIIHLHAKIPVINAKTNPKINGKISLLLAKNSDEVKSFNTFPKIRGTTIRKENLAAFSLSIPSRTAVDIVAPEREIPGIIAIA